MDAGAESGEGKQWPLHWRRLDLRLAAFPGHDSCLLDRRIAAVFGLTHTEAEDGASSQGLLEGWVERLLFIRMTLLQAVGIAIFEPGRVLAVSGGESRGAGGWQIETAMPELTGTDPAVGMEAVRQATLVLHWLNGLTDESAPQIARLQERIASQMLRPLRRMVGPVRKPALPLLRQAESEGIPVRHLFEGVYLLGWGAKAIYFEPTSVQGDTAIGSRLSQNKWRTANLLRQAGLPGMQQGLAATPEQAVAAAQSIGWPVVVKPVDCDRGEGVAIDLRTAAAVQAAAERALALSHGKRAVVEPMLKGVCHRLVMIDGALLYAVRRGPKAVVGDGVRSVRSLVDEANLANRRLPPWRRDPAWPSDEQAEAALAAAGFTMESVPAAGAKAPLRHIESTADGGLDDDVTALLHPDNLELAQRVQRLFGLSVIGIDLMTEDISVSWKLSGAMVNEVNFSPLIGGAPISRGYLPGFFRLLDAVPGRIPVEVVLGGGAAGRALAEAMLARLVSEGFSARLVCAEEGGGFASCFRAFVLDRAAEALVVLVASASDMAEPWPIDRITAFRDSGEAWPEQDAARATALARLKAACVSRETPRAATPA